MPRLSNPRVKAIDAFYLKFQVALWGLSLAFLVLMKTTSQKVTMDDMLVIGVFAFEIALFAYFMRFSAKYFLRDKKARRHWFIPSVVLFVFLTFPFIFSILRPIFFVNPQ